MFNVGRFLTQGILNTLLLKNNSGFSHNGPYKHINDDTLIDKWHIGDIGSAEYTISADLNPENREILKCLVTASANNANVAIFAKNYTSQELVDIEVRVNDSVLELRARPKTSKTAGTKLIFTAHYFHNQNSL